MSSAYEQVLAKPTVTDSHGAQASQKLSSQAWQHGEVAHSGKQGSNKTLPTQIDFAEADKTRMGQASDTPVGHSGEAAQSAKHSIKHPDGKGGSQPAGGKIDEPQGPRLSKADADKVWQALESARLHIPQHYLPVQEAEKIPSNAVQTKDH
jgi:hypothetical protein